MPAIIAVDIGTTHCKCIITNEKGTVIGAQKSSYPSYSDATGKHEQNADDIYDAVIDLLNKSVNTLNIDISCVAFSSAMHGIMAVDAIGRPLTNIITWADTRSNAFAQQLKLQGKADDLYHATGTPVHPMSPLCKIMWMQQNMADIVAKTQKFISVKEYIFYKLFGVYVVDYSIASATGLFNIHTRKWNAASLQAAGIAADHLSMPVVITHHEIFTAKQHALSGVFINIPFVIGSSDGCTAQLGSGALAANEACITIGTSGAVRRFIYAPETDALQRTFTYVFTDELYLCGGATNNGGNTLSWVASFLWDDVAQDDALFKNIIALAATAPAGCDGLQFVPYIYGERAPVWDAEAKGSFINVTHLHTRKHFARAVIEGVLYNLHTIFLSLPGVEKIDTLYANGGFLENPFIAQLVKDIFGMNVKLQQDSDASALGAAYIGMAYLGYKNW
jgi:gluconokinase